MVGKEKERPYSRDGLPGAVPFDAGDDTPPCDLRAHEPVSLPALQRPCGGRGDSG